MRYLHATLQRQQAGGRGRDFEEPGQRVQEVQLGRQAAVRYGECRCLLTTIQYSVYVIDLPLADSLSLSVCVGAVPAVDAADSDRSAGHPRARGALPVVVAAVHCR